MPANDHHSLMRSRMSLSNILHASFPSTALVKPASSSTSSMMIQQRWNMHPHQTSQDQTTEDAPMLPTLAESVRKHQWYARVSPKQQWNSVRVEHQWSKAGTPYPGTPGDRHVIPHLLEQDLTDPRTRARHPKRRCKFSRCDKCARKGGFCISHGGGVRCSHAIGCTKSAQRGGYCYAHGGGIRCKYQGCPRAPRLHGMCKNHSLM